MRRSLDPPLLNDALLEPIHAVNRQLLDELVKLARGSPESCRLRLTPQMSEILVRMDDEAVERVARCPFLLVDGGFRYVERWSAAAIGSPLPDTEGDAWLGQAQAVSLAHSSLTVAWHVSRAHPDAAGLVIGASAECAALIGSLTPRQLQDIAQRHSHWIRPRWIDRPDVWREFLSLAVRKQVPGRAIVMRGLQLFFGDFLPP